MVVQQAKDGKGYGATGYANRGFSNLIDASQKLSKLTQKLVNGPDKETMRRQIEARQRIPQPLLDLSGQWRNVSNYIESNGQRVEVPVSQYLTVVDHNPYSGSFCLKFPLNDGSGFNLFFGGAKTVVEPRGTTAMEIFCAGIVGRKTMKVPSNYVSVGYGNNSKMVLRGWQENVPYTIEEQNYLR